jgi:uncharacterized protein YecT (DUF1311 family)
MRRSLLRPAAVLFAATLVVTIAVAQPGRAAPAASAPVIHEPFTRLPCPSHPVSTLDLEGCAEKKVVATDKKIDAEAETISGRLQDAAARSRFAKAQSAWLAFRTADCASVSDQNEGGTLAGITALGCAADRSAERLKELRSFASALAG